MLISNEIVLYEACVLFFSPHIPAHPKKKHSIIMVFTVFASLLNKVSCNKMAENAQQMCRKIYVVIKGG